MYPSQEFKKFLDKIKNSEQEQMDFIIQRKQSDRIHIFKPPCAYTIE